MAQDREALDLKGLLLVAILAVQAQAQIVLDRFGGLDDTDAPASLQPYESQDLLNVESNLTGTAAVKRKGFSQEGSLTVSTAPVTGSHTFKDSSGNTVTLVFHDRYASKSTNGSAFSNWLTTAPASVTRWQCVDVGGKAYCVNDQRIAPLEYDGTTQRPPASMPAGAVIELCGDRLAIADISATPNRVSYSQSGVYTNFTTGSDTADPWTDDFGTPGDRVTGLKCDRGRLYIFKTASIISCILGDQYTTKCFPVSNAVGTLDPLSIVGAPDGIYFRSQDRAYWRLNDDGLTLLSQKISNLVKSQTVGSQQSNTQTTQTDWAAGAQTPVGSWSTSTISGSVFASSVTAASATITGIGHQSDVDLTYSGSAPYINVFSNNDMTTGLGLTQRIGTLIASGQELRASGSSRATASAVVYHSTGTWGLVFKSTSGCNASASAVTMYFLSSSTDATTTSGYQIFASCLAGSGRTNVGIVEFPSGFSSFTSENTCLCDGNYHSLKATRAHNGFMTAWYDGILAAAGTDTTVSTSTYVIVDLQDSTDLSRVHVDSVTVPAFYLNQVSRAYDTQFSTPIYGQYNITLSSSMNTSATFYAQVSGDGSSWDAAVTLTNGSRPGVAAKRFFRHSITPGPPYTVALGTVSAVDLQAATTGQFRTQCIQPGPSVSSWGILSCDETKLGAGSLVYYATAAYSCAALSTMTPVEWPVATNNATLGLAVSVSSAVYIGFRDLLGSATDQAQVNACTLYWNVGTAAQPSWAVYDSLKNSVLWSAAINNSATNNRVLKYDLNLDAWYPFSITATALDFVNSSVYFGSSSSGTWNKYGSVDADNGGAINAYWKSKDFAGASPFQETDWTAVSVVARNQVTGSMTGTYNLSTGNSGTYTVSLGTTTTKTYVRSSYYLPKSSPSNFINAQFGNNSTTPFELLGLRFDGVSLPWRPTGP